MAFVGAARRLRGAFLAWWRWQEALVFGVSFSGLDVMI